MTEKAPTEVLEDKPAEKPSEPIVTFKKEGNEYVYTRDEKADGKIMYITRLSYADVKDQVRRLNKQISDHQAALKIVKDKLPENKYTEEELKEMQAFKDMADKVHKWQEAEKERDQVKYHEEHIEIAMKEIKRARSVVPELFRNK